MPGPEFRRDPLSGRWVIIASDRDARPSDFEVVPPLTADHDCPFCGGHEEQTPPALATFGQNGNGLWGVRVVPNKFPAVEPNAWNADEHSDTELFQRHAAAGEHEIIIESPQHIESLTQLTLSEVHCALTAYQQRLQWHEQNGRWRYAQWFKNVGAFAGASLRHAHSQLVAMPMVPKRLSEELQVAERYHRAEGACLFCRLIEAEAQSQSRVVASSKGYLAFCPFASRFAYETWIVPTPHQSHFTRVSEAELMDLADMLLTTLARIESCCGSSGYNVLLHTSPFGQSERVEYHWRLEIIPRLTRQAGFEWGSEYWINPVAPEQAAVELKC